MKRRESELYRSELFFKIISGLNKKVLNLNQISKFAGVNHSCVRKYLKKMIRGNTPMLLVVCDRKVKYYYLNPEFKWDYYYFAIKNIYENELLILKGVF